MALENFHRYAIVTISTVGYGDKTATSVEGKICICLTIVGGIMYMAMPLSIVGANFAEVWEDRDKIILFQKVVFAIYYPCLHKSTKLSESAEISIHYTFPTLCALMPWRRGCASTTT